LSAFDLNGAIADVCSNYQPGMIGESLEKKATGASGRSDAPPCGNAPRRTRTFNPLINADFRGPKNN
jgi:hypothetical protein